MTTEQLTAREIAWRDFPNDADEIIEARFSPSTKCRQELCRAPIWWGRTAATGARAPFDVKPDGTRVGTNHWRTCRQRPERPRKPKADAA